MTNSAWWQKKYQESVEINHNPNWHYIPGNSYKILIIGGSRSVLGNVLLNLIKPQRQDIHSNQRINYLWTKEKKQQLKN